MRKLFKNLVYIFSMRRNLLSFPWNVPLNLIEMLVSLTLTVSSFLIGTAAFVLGLYLTRFEKMAPKDKLMPYLYLIVSLVSPPVIAIATTCIITVCSCQPLWMKIYLLLILFTPIVPAIAVIYILIHHSPQKREF